MSKFLQKLKSFLERGILPEDSEFDESELALFKEMQDFNFLTEYFENPNVFELIFHCDSFVEILSHQKRTHRHLPYDRNYIDLAFQLNALEKKIRWNQLNYQVSYQSQIGEHKVRVTMLHKVVQNSDHKYFIRKRERKTFPLEQFSLPDINFKDKNVLISGATGSGKTSLLNSLINENCLDHHHIILEDTRELQVNSPYTTHLCSPERLEEYCADAMRLSPRNLILGEMRSYEVIPFTLLLTSGHKGFLTTIHANSALGSLERVALLYSLYSRNPVNKGDLLTLLCQNLDYLVYMHEKQVLEVVAIKGHKNGHYLYENIGQEALPEAV